jgi:hypothetical protein
VYEEVGIALCEEGEFLGQLPSLSARVGGREVGLVVVPFVYYLTVEPSLRTNEEVAQFIWADLGALGARDQDTTVVVARDGLEASLPAWLVGERPVWGLTYSILRSFFDLLRSDREG